MLATTDLWFRYQDEPVLKGLTLDFSRHAVTGLVGANGCGKSTLFMNLSGLLRPQQGAVLWQGEALNYSKRGLLALRQQVATVFQDPDQQIFYTDIDSDIAFSLRNLGVAEEEIARRVERTMELVGLDQKGDRKPNQLSGGQQQRVSIARALVRNPPIILADEPTGALDSHTGREVLGMLQELHKQGHTVVLITHDNSIAVQAERIIRLEDGVVVYDGDAHAPEAVVQPNLMMSAPKAGEEGANA